MYMKYQFTSTFYVVGGFNPFEKYAQLKLDHFTKDRRGENKIWFKPPPRYILDDHFVHTLFGQEVTRNLGYHLFWTNVFQVVTMTGRGITRTASMCKVTAYR